MSEPTTTESAHAAPVDPTTGDVTEQNPDVLAAEAGADPEPVELDDGTRVEFVRDLVQYGYAEDPANRPKTEVPFAVRIVEASGAERLVKMESASDAANAQHLVALLDQLGYRRP